MWWAAHAAHQFGGFVTMIRPLNRELERFFEKSGNYLPVPELGARLAADKWARLADLNPPPLKPKIR
jgi:hypothetical protein